MRRFPLVVAALLFGFGCGSDPAAVVDTLQRVVGSQGGTLALPSGVSLDVPGSALTGDVVVIIREIDDVVAAGYAAPPDFVGGELLATVVLEPHGTTFASPITLKIPFTGDPSEVVILRVADADSTEWEPVGPVTFADGVATIPITTFSGYALARVAAGSCPCYTGRDLEVFLAEGRRATNAEPDARFDIQISTGPRLSDASRCARDPNDLRCRPAGDQEYLTSLIFNEDLFYAYPLVKGTVAPDDSLVGSAVCETWAIGQAATLADYARYFPGVPGTMALFPWYTPGTYFSTQFPLTTAAEVRACHALVTRSASRAVAQIGYAVDGLPTGEALVVAQTGQPPVALLVDGRIAWDFTPVDVGGTYEVAIVSQPASATCVVAEGALQGTVTANTIISFVCARPEICNGVDDDADGSTDEGFDVDEDGVTTCGPDGIAGNADDDCNDDDANIKPGATERCNGKDDDCSGAPLVGETTDTDLDGVPDACDAHPADACGVFNLARVLEVKALTGATCQIDATGTAIPTAIAAELDMFTGAFIDYNGGAFETVGVGTLADGWYVINGCLQDGSAGYCTDNGRPLLPASSESDEATYDRCADVVEYACAP